MMRVKCSKVLHNLYNTVILHEGHVSLFVS